MTNADTESNIRGTLLSVNVGKPRNVLWQEKTVYTGVYKDAVTGPRWAGRLNLDGDGQGDLKGHGGEQRAILVYQRESYDHWSAYLGRDDLRPGSFGENFTVAGLADDEVCIGDRYRIGEAEFEVSQPRVTCFRVGMRLGEPQMPALLVGHRRPGFYMRVITEGEVRPGDPIVRTRTGPHQLTVAEVDALLYLPNRSEASLQKALQIPALSPGWQQSFRDMSATGLQAATVSGPTIGTEPGWNGFRPMTVTRIVRETATVVSVYLSAGDGLPLKPAIPGQYLTFRIPQGQEPAAIRSYSISGAPDPGTYRISIKREEHGHISRLLHDTLVVGTVLDVAAPRGEFALREGTGPVLLISAGVGATPVVAMLHALARTRSRRETWWIHTARTPAEHLFADEAGRYLNSLQNGRAVTFYTQSGSPGTSAVSGRPTSERFRALGLPVNGTAYICGPVGFINNLTAVLADLGMDSSRIYSELFSSLAPINPGLVGQQSVSPHQPAGAPGTGPAVTFGRSGLTARWRETDASLLELAEACDIPTRWSCRSGVCHTCMTPLISGAISYRPAPLELPPAGQVLLCCAYPDEDVILDT